MTKQYPRLANHDKIDNAAYHYYRAEWYYENMMQARDHETKEDPWAQFDALALRGLYHNAKRMSDQKMKYLDPTQRKMARRIAEAYLKVAKETGKVVTRQEMVWPMREQ